MHLLLIDHNIHSLKIYQDIFEIWGYEVSICINGKEALDLVQSQMYDVVVTEMDVPGISGINLIRSLKKQNPLRPLIVLTENASVKSAIKAIKGGADEYIQKPIKVEQLRSLISKLTPQNQKGAGEQIQKMVEQTTARLKESMDLVLTHIHLAEERYRILEEFQRVSLEHIAEGIMILDNQGIIRMVNCKMCDILGLDPFCATGKNLFKIKPALRKTVFADLFHKALAGKVEEFTHFSFQHNRRESSKELSARIATVELKLHQGHFSGIVFTVTQIH